MTTESIQTAQGRIWYHKERVEAPEPALFDPEAWRQKAEVAETDGGRGASWFIDDGARRLVLRSYRRGGLVGRLIHDWYWYTGERRTRPAREWRMLRFLEQQDLPAPRPVAARYVRNGPVYRADMLTERLPHTRPLSAALCDEPLADRAWRDVGHTIRVFHNAGVCHADLNAHNILIGAGGRVYLIDFDRASRRRAGSWQQRNLARLARSLSKLAAERHPFHFRRSDWDELVKGYGSARR